MLKLEDVIRVREVAEPLVILVSLHAYLYIAKEFHSSHLFWFRQVSTAATLPVDGQSLTSGFLLKPQAS